MHSLTCMSVVVGVMRKLRPCNIYSRRRDRINSLLWRSYYKGGGGYLWKDAMDRRTCNASVCLQRAGVMAALSKPELAVRWDRFKANSVQAWAELVQHHKHP